ncbi:unnamed protein product [Prorocentrum cordatum]|uniref:Uncharacterized protein n=1 Tax=Prorocentrum cordatum TaxID=2364126 RepID=A0ABN9UNB9_9DINO|nr:unnamed protein product [Polarella glacialis]
MATTFKIACDPVAKRCDIHVEYQAFLLRARVIGGNSRWRMLKGGMQSYLWALTSRRPQIRTEITFKAVKWAMVQNYSPKFEVFTNLQKGQTSHQWKPFLRAQVS